MKARFIAFILAIFSSHAGDWAWRETLSPHFVVSHERAWMPGGFIMSLERMHSRLRLDLAMFSPWMAKERLKLYLYKNQKSYKAGEFSPPEWSNGIALYDRKTVAVYDQPDKDKLLEVISHETTHLIFEGYWGEAHKTPPSWLNEGLAMMEEGASQEQPERSPWYEAMAYLPERPTIPMEDFLKINPTQDLKDKQADVGVWYVQAYALVYFLFRQHSRLQFKNFCEKLRGGKDIEESLWLVYRLHSLNDFEKVWKAWLRDPVHKKRLPARSSFSIGEEKEKEPIGAIKGFKPLRP